MSNDDDAFDFIGRGDEFDEAQQKVALEGMAQIMVPMFKAFVEAGLSGQEAAALVAAFWAQNMPSPSPKPMED